MNNIDTFFASSLERMICTHLGDTTFHSIQNRLFEKYGMSITESMNGFQKLDSVLREFFGAGAEGLERKFLEGICTIKSKKDKVENRFTISDPKLSQSILRAFSDDEMTKILNASIGEPWTITEILEKLDIPKSSGYRKINSLIEQGLLIKAGHDFTANRRTVDKYKSLFDNVNIDFSNKLSVNVQFTQEVIRSSTVLQTVYCN
ncbi:transcriptional regulator [Nitrosopumilus sp.]|uniref:helix-turn-helix domain-containing protein n=1 Tax=Nitrosopumilus sp. TaxID=2024843 RepID=UPI00247B7295|nr:transcriptional regulator [Nitrosopumilus sp.]MCV0431843.1 transcriptional regulator [Nitrosopumilus sp.]